MHKNKRYKKYKAIGILSYAELVKRITGFAIEGKKYILVTKNGITQKLYTERMLCYNINMKKYKEKYK